MRSPVWLSLIAAVWLALTAPAQRLIAQEPNFERDVAPIFRERCLRCHNDRQRRGGLSLQTAQSTRQGGDSGEVLTPENTDSGTLLSYITPTDGVAEMPQGEAPLDPEQLQRIRQWIKAGAHWPEDLRLEPEPLWSLRPLQQPPVPDGVGAPEFPVRNPIDAFIAAGLRAAGLRPAPAADQRTLARRLHLDLLGLPPSPEMVEAFAADDRPGAYERLVDRLLASPHFGERWGRHWLDLARYADSDGYLGDSERTHAWVYREWVIDAINRDQPFDRFSIEQLAGDLLPTPSVDQRVATGFHRNTLRNTEAGVDLELYRTKEIVDRVNTTGMVWLGLTLGCAECHDHKHDPVTQTEFYQLYAFFNNADEVGVSVSRNWEHAEHQRAFQDWDSRREPLLSELAKLERESVADAERSAAIEQLNATKSIDWEPFAAAYRTDSDGWAPLKAKLEAWHKARPAPPATKAPAFAERRQDRRESYVHVRGVYNQRGESVHAGTPAALPALNSESQELDPDRLDLAEWLFDDRNPLPPRVAANRVWQHLFGQGLVATPNDFGFQGDKPVHPQLLDWLASEYRRLGWSRKALIRLIVTSSTYRLASAANAVPEQRETSNLLLWRQNSFRVNAETIRDLHLTASGLLDRTIGRRGIRPPLPDFVAEVGRSVKWPVSAGGERYRRGLYIFFKRTVPYPMLMTFDSPDSTVSCSRRARTNTPLQALTLLNDPVYFECAETLGRRVAAHHAQELAAIAAIFRHCLARPMTTAEQRVLLSAYRDLLELAAGDSAGNSAGNNVATLAEQRAAALAAVARIVMNSDEFVTRD
ncbi:MAG: PSD1 domain-containing protein [Planctomycetales bacterium]|nr:PSD1 domain-containing protein [Planctomycetales bacterium]